MGLAEAIKYFYEQWLLRDVLSYITPGAIVAGAIALQYQSLDELVELLNTTPLLAYVPIFGVLFIIGFGLQNLGEMVHAIKWHDRKGDRDKDEDRTQLECLETFHRATCTKHESPKPGEGASCGWLERTRERISVKKNMSGTGLVSITIALLFFSIDLIGVRDELLTPAVFLLVVVLILSLWRGHTHQRKLQKYWEDIVACDEQTSNSNSEAAS